MLNPGAPIFGLTKSCMFESQSASDIGRQGQLVKPVWAAHVSVPVVFDHLSLYFYFAYRFRWSLVASRFLLNDNICSICSHITDEIDDS